MRSPTRSGFTLTELLVAITIIAILAGLVWAGVARARETARIAKTKSTIAKINQVIMERYDSYRTRRVPIDIRGLPPRDAAKVRLWAIRCIMAWEMPDRAGDVTSSDALEYPEISNR
ncbi:MAG: type II secretion system protein, partial [Thermogutta sp.]